MRGYGSLMVDDDQRVRRRSAMIGAGSMTAAVVLLVIVFLAVDLGSEPGPDTLAPTTLPVTTVDVPDTSPAIIYTPTDPSVTPAPTTSSTIVTSIPLDQRILIASPSGISTVVGASSTSIDSGSWVIALRLSDGSIVAQKVWPGYQQPGDNTIYRIVDGVATPLIAPTDPNNEWIRLHDVIIENGSDRILYSKKSGVGYDDAIEELFLGDLVGGEPQLIGVIGDWETGPDRLSIGGNIIAGQVWSQIERSPLIIDRSGTRIDTTRYGLGDNFVDCATCPAAFAVDDKGSRLAWIEGDLVVVIDTTTASRVAEFSLPAGLGANVDSLQVGDNTILVNAYDPATGTLGRPYLFGFDGTSTQLPVIGLASFDR